MGMTDLLLHHWATKAFLDWRQCLSPSPSLLSTFLLFVIVVVALLDDDGRSFFEWKVDIRPGRNSQSAARASHHKQPSRYVVGGQTHSIHRKCLRHPFFSPLTVYIALHVLPNRTGEKNTINGHL